MVVNPNYMDDGALREQDRIPPQEDHLTAMPVAYTRGVRALWPDE